MRFLDEDEELNPILSAVNLIDVFLVIIAALLIAIAQNPLNVFRRKGHGDQECWRAQYGSHRKRWGRN